MTPAASRSAQILAAAGLAAIMACAGASRSAPAAEPASSHDRYVYTCADEYRLAVRFASDSAVLTLPARSVTLPQVASASGAKYQAAGVVLWTKGNTARVEVGDTVYEDCLAVAVAGPWEEARLLGATFRAIGQEPGWSIEVHPDRMRYYGDYGRTLIVTPLPEADHVDPATVVYDAETEAHALRVTIRRAPCTDTMSGISFTHVVELLVDGLELRGCGQPV